STRRSRLRPRVPARGAGPHRPEQHQFARLVAQPLIHVPARRRLGPAILLGVVALTAGWLYLVQIALRPTALWSGLALLAVVLFLAFFNARKKLPFLPLLKASAWMRFHSYAGWFAVALFLLHIQFRVPQGQLEIVLALLFVAVSASGVAGLI